MPSQRVSHNDSPEIPPPPPLLVPTSTPYAMKTSKPITSDPSSSRRAQPPRQTRNNPPRSSVAGSRQFGGSRASLGGPDGPQGPDEPVEMCPAITYIADTLTALPKESVRHFTLLKEVDGKLLEPQKELSRLVSIALSAPLTQRSQPAGNYNGSGSDQIGTQGSLNGANSSGPSAQPGISDPLLDPANLPRRQHFHDIRSTIQGMLLSLDEKNHVLSTAGEALNKQLARIDAAWPYLNEEISDEARYGSSIHWAYPENRTHKSNTSGNARRDLAALNNLSAAAQQDMDEAAARSNARKQALLAKKANRQPVESDFDDHQEARHKEKKAHGNSKVRKAVDAAIGVTSGTTNGVNGNAAKKRKVDKGQNGSGGAAMDRSMSSVFGANGTAMKKIASSRESGSVDPPKKQQRVAKSTKEIKETPSNTRKRNNTVTSMAQITPSVPSSPIRSTFPDTTNLQPAQATNGGRPATARGRQNSTQIDIAKQQSLSTKANGSAAGTPDISTETSITERNISDIKSALKEHVISPANQHLQGAEQSNLDTGRESTLKREESVPNGEPSLRIQSTIVTTKSGRASKLSTPIIPQFPEPVRSRSSRNVLESASSNKRSHKKGAGAAAQQLRLQQGQEDDEASSIQGDDDDADGTNADDPDEDTYCYCNRVSFGEMVGCDGDACEREWFHLGCVGLKVAPKSNVKWYCDDCKEKLKSKRLNSR